MELILIGLVAFFLSLAISEVKNFNQLSFFALLHGLILLPLSLSHVIGFIARFIVSILVFLFLLYFIKVTNVRQESSSQPSILSLSALGILLAITLAILSILQVKLGVIMWSLSLALGFFITLLKRDIFKVILGVYVIINSAHGLLLTFTKLGEFLLFFDITELAVVGTMLWVALQVYRQYRSLDSWRVNLLRW